MPKTQRSSTQQDADAIERVREILWPADDPQRQWTPDTLDRIAEVVFTLVHLDNPSPEVVRQRRREFDPATYFCWDCPLCEVMKESGVIVFDESVADGEDA